MIMMEWGVSEILIHIVKCQLGHFEGYGFHVLWFEKVFVDS